MLMLCQKMNSRSPQALLTDLADGMRIFGFSRLIAKLAWELDLFRINPSYAMSKVGGMMMRICLLTASGLWMRHIWNLQAKSRKIVANKQ